MGFPGEEGPVGNPGNSGRPGMPGKLKKKRPYFRFPILAGVF